MDITTQTTREAHLAIRYIRENPLQGARFAPMLEAAERTGEFMLKRCKVMGIKFSNADPIEDFIASTFVAICWQHFGDQSWLNLIER